MGWPKLEFLLGPYQTAREFAIIQAEKNYYGGKYACDVWKGFAKRGMGVDAVQHKGGHGSWVGLGWVGLSLVFMGHPLPTQIMGWVR
jgi:hypothetical protein